MDTGFGPQFRIRLTNAQCFTYFANVDTWISCLCWPWENLSFPELITIFGNFLLARQRLNCFPDLHTNVTLRKDFSFHGGLHQYTQGHCCSIDRNPGSAFVVCLMHAICVCSCIRWPFVEQHISHFTLFHGTIENNKLQEESVKILETGNTCVPWPHHNTVTRVVFSSEKCGWSVNPRYSSAKQTNSLSL